VVSLADGRGHCTECDRIYNTAEYARRHFVMAHTQTRIMCKVCHKEYANVFSFRNHVKQGHHISGVKNVVGVYGVRL
jgi:hypothetical protein